MNAQQSLALSRTRVSYGCRPEVETVCAAAEQWFTLQELLTAHGHPGLLPRDIDSWIPKTDYVEPTGYMIAQDFVILREPVRLDEDPSDGDENA
jgi:hypothetical protein